MIVRGVVVCGAWRGTLKTPWADSTRLHVYIRNVPVYAGNTRTYFSARARDDRRHREVLNVHTVTLNLHPEEQVRK